jgi:hypothetical protein
LRRRLHAVTTLGEVEGIFDEYLRSRERFEHADHGSTDEAPLEAAEV